MKMIDIADHLRAESDLKTEADETNHRITNRQGVRAEAVGTKMDTQLSSHLGANAHRPRTTWWKG